MVIWIFTVQLPESRNNFREVRPSQIWYIYLKCQSRITEFTKIKKLHIHSIKSSPLSRRGVTRTGLGVRFCINFNQSHEVHIFPYTDIISFALHRPATHYGFAKNA
jgi:hypothetical protein